MSSDRSGLRDAARPLTAAVLTVLAGAGSAAAQQFIGLDPYMRPVYGRSALIPEPLPDYGPVFRAKPGKIGGPQVAGPLYYADPIPEVGRRHNPYSASRAGAVLGFDPDDALAQARIREFARRR